MAALLDSTPAVPPDLRGRVSLPLAVGLVAVVTGFGVFFSGVMLPDSQFQAIEVPHRAVHRGAVVRFDPVQDAMGPTANPRLFITAVSRADADYHAEPGMAYDHNGMDQSGPGIVQADLQQKARLARGCRGTWADSAHLAPIPGCADLRQDLAMMAAAQHAGRWMRWDASGAVAAQVGRDDRIAQALFAPASDGASASARRALPGGSWRPRRPPW